MSKRLDEAMRNVDKGTITEEDAEVIIDTAAKLTVEKNLEEKVQKKLCKVFHWFK